MRQLLLFLFLIIGMVAIAQPDLAPKNATLVSHTTLPGNENGNDIWGYVDANGIEYAIIGGASNTHIYSLEDFENPQLRASIPGTTTIWRDMKVWEDHIYVTTDNSQQNTNYDGLLIIDMSGAPEVIEPTFIKQTFDFSGASEELGSCHNIYIDEDGFAYLAGCNVGVGGVIILDLKPDKKVPTYIGTTNDRYSHDVYVQDSLMYTSDIFNGIFSVYDIRDRANPEFVVGDQTSFDFTHNAWTSTDGNFLFTTDERANAYVDAWDISDPMNVERVDRYRPIDTEGRGVIPHNTHYFNGYLVTSWYTDGLKIIDANKPDNLVEVAKYDTWDGAHGGFFGNWGAYPFSPSGYMFASDINTGLYIIDVDFKRACYLEGKVTDIDSGFPIVNTDVTILESDPNRNTSDPSGDYKTGQVEEGTFEVLFDHPNYRLATGMATIASGEVTILDMQLKQIELNVRVVDPAGNPLPDAKVYIANNDIVQMDEISTNTDGMATIGLRDNENYLVQAAVWGYKSVELPSYFMTENPDELVITLEKGFEDDFFVDLGWTISGDASAGVWERGIPNITTIQGDIINPGSDSNNDIGDFAFITGNAANVGWTEDDVDNGFTTITSPTMDWSEADAADISFETWFFIGGSGTPDDTLRVTLSNGIDEIILHEESDPSANWTLQEMNVDNEMIEFTAEMSITVRSSDEGDGNIVESGFDAFEATLSIIDNTTEIDPTWTYAIAPNPFTSQVTINANITEATQLKVTDLYGKVIAYQTIFDNLDLNTKDWPAGIYIVQLQSENRYSSVKKIVKQ